jgi:hypothetical protein
MIGVRLPPELVRKIKVYAAVAGITTQEMIRKAMVEYVARHPIPAATPIRITAEDVKPIRIEGMKPIKVKAPGKERS